MILYFSSNTYIEVQAKAGAVWFFQNFQLVHEYQKRSFLPPPLSIISQIYDLLHWMYRSCKPKKEKGKVQYENIYKSRA